jgi:carbon-monoxide dehydrogenase large subunit
MVFTMADMAGVLPITAVSGLAGFKVSSQPVLASDKVRHVGEAIAVCVATTRAEAEDLAGAVELDLDEIARRCQYAGRAHAGGAA